MKKYLKPFILLLIFAFTTFNGYSQKRDNTFLKDTHVAPSDKNLAMNTIKDLSLFYNVRQFGAKGDSLAFDTEAINKAIDAAAATGGGTIYFPAGKYLSFSIRLKSNITLFLDDGAVLIAADPNQGKGGYDAPEPNAWDKYQDFGHSQVSFTINH